MPLLSPLPENPTISIVDDDPAVRDALWRLMDSAGLAATAFSSAEEFLASPSRDETTCLILDVRMPGMNGLELQRHLVASNWKVPIIFISALAEAGTRERALQAGAVEFFEKPFNSAALLDAIDAARVARAPGAPGK
jgi:FixJ family two-component response regulator